MKITGYTAGSLYKRFYGSNMYQMNRAAVANASSAMSSYGTTIFDTTVSHSQGISEIVAKQYAERVEAEATAKLQSATSSITSLSDLASSIDTTA